MTSSDNRSGVLRSPLERPPFARRRVLCLAPFCHMPPSDGASQRAINLLQALAARYALHLLAYRKHDAAALAGWAGEQGIALGWLPEPPKPQVGFWRRVGARLPPGFASHDPQAIQRSVAATWAAHGPFDLIFCATQLLGQGLADQRWPAPTVLDLYDVYAPLAREKIARARPLRPYRWLFRLEAARVRAHERRVLRAHSMLLTISQPDARVAAALAPGVPLRVLPHGVHVPAFVPAGARGPVALLVASFGHGPNLEGLRWLYERVWPLVRRALPGATLLLVGQPSEAARAVTGGDGGVEWAGRVPDVAPFYRRAACAVVPILGGGGVRHKLLEALAWGVPTVSTGAGARGLELDDALTIADAPAAFAAAVVARLREPERFAAQAAHARALVAERHSWDCVGALLLDYLDVVMSPVEAAHRVGPNKL